MLAIQVITYISVAIAAIAVIAKVVGYATAPLGMRWELYPVPHEKGKAEYGGSYVEELDWWTKPRESDMVNEIKEMLSEIILLKGVYHNNKKLWVRSFPFHMGLYLSCGWLGLLLIGSIMELVGMQVGAGAGTLGMIVHFLTVSVGFAGLGLTLLGATGLFFWRLTDKDQAKFNTPIDYINLLVLIAATALAIAASVTADPSFAVIRGYVASLLTFKAIAITSSLIVAEIVAGSLLIVLITVTRMSHFVAKYFLYHAVRWNDTPNERGSDIEKAIMKNLERKIGWSASHIQTGKSWGEVVSEVKK
jgi:nitrate reductase gamma subunit